MHRNQVQDEEGSQLNYSIFSPSEKGTLFLQTCLKVSTILALFSFAPLNLYLFHRSCRLGTYPLRNCISVNMTQVLCCISVSIFPFCFPKYSLDVSNFLENNYILNAINIEFIIARARHTFKFFDLNFLSKAKSAKHEPKSRIRWLHNFWTELRTRFRVKVLILCWTRFFLDFYL